MRIAQVHVYAHDLPVRDGPYTMSGREIWSVDSTIVRLVSDTGITGWGEVCPLGATYAPVTAGGVRAALALAAPALIGVEAKPRAVARAVDGVLTGQAYARAALDIAAHDLLGRALGVPVATLLGGALRDRVPSYYALGIGAPDEVARIARDKADGGYPRLQIKVGGREVDEDIATIAKVFEAVGGRVRIAVDANRGLTTREAIHLSRACADLPFVLEQPCDGVAANASLHGRIAHPLYLDESMTDLATIARTINAGIVDGFGMKLSRLGGLAAFAAFRDLAAAHRLPHTCDDSWGGDIVAAACAQMGATVADGQLDGVWLATPYQAESYGPGASVRVRDGHVDVPQGPGLGIEPEPGRFGDPILSEGG